MCSGVSAFGAHLHSFQLAVLRIQLAALHVHPGRQLIQGLPRSPATTNSPQKAFLICWASVQAPAVAVHASP